MKIKYYIIIFLIILIFLYTRPRYISYLPTLPFYNNNEAQIVLEKWKNKTDEDIAFFHLTDPSIISPFLDHINETKEEILSFITSSRVLNVILFLKYLINRPRPYQIEKKIIPLISNTGSTPSLPAGHAFQAYYLAHILSKKYPEKTNLFKEIASKCDDVRVKGGIHYPSDGILSKNIVNFFIKIGIY